ncbi:MULTISPECIES: nucleotide exchange factor GrpE [unclassified Frankia]
MSRRIRLSRLLPGAGARAALRASEAELAETRAAFDEERARTTDLRNRLEAAERDLADLASAPDQPAADSAGAVSLDPASADPPGQNSAGRDEAGQGRASVELGADAGRESRAREPAWAAEPHPVVDQTIALVEQLADLTKPEPRSAEENLAIMEWLGEQATKVLDQCDVVRITDNGPVDPDRHEIVATRTTGQADLAEWIAATVRPGYAWRGQLLRPAAVVVYRYADEAGQPGGEH